MTVKDDCTCGHDRSHHYRDPSTRTLHNCLAVHCDCKTFEEPKVVKKSVLRPIDQADNGPETPRLRLTKPHADTSCDCSACEEWQVQRFMDRWK